MIGSRRENLQKFQEVYDQFHLQIRNCARRFNGLHSYDIDYVESILLESLWYAVLHYDQKKSKFKTFFWLIAQQELMNLQKKDKCKRRAVGANSISLFNPASLSADSSEGENKVISLVEKLSSNDDTERDLITRDLLEKIVTTTEEERSIITLIREGYSDQDILTKLGKTWWQLHKLIGNIRTNTLKRLKGNTP